MITNEELKDFVEKYRNGDEETRNGIIEILVEKANPLLKSALNKALSRKGKFKPTDPILENFISPGGKFMIIKEIFNLICKEKPICNEEVEKLFEIIGIGKPSRESLTLKEIFDTFDHYLQVGKGPFGLFKIFSNIISTCVYKVSKCSQISTLDNEERIPPELIEEMSSKNLEEEIEKKKRDSIFQKIWNEILEKVVLEEWEKAPVETKLLILRDTPYGKDKEIKNILEEMGAFNNLPIPAVKKGALSDKERKRVSRFYNKIKLEVCKKIIEKFGKEEDKKIIKKLKPDDFNKNESILKSIVEKILRNLKDVKYNDTDV